MEFLNANNGVLYCGKNPIILRGMGLGGWLLPEGYMWKFYTKCDRPRRMETLINELCGENCILTAILLSRILRGLQGRALIPYGLP